MEQETIKFLNKSFSLAFVLVLGLLIFLAGQMIYQLRIADQQNMNQITVSGESKIYAKPDIALVDLGVTTTGLTTQDVVSKNTEKMNAVIKAVKDMEVDEKDIQTTKYNLYPLYNYTQTAGRVFQGYTLEQNISVKIRDFSKVGDILQKATSSGANLTGNLVFAIDDTESYKNQARAEAIEKAKEKAKELAKESGIKLGKIINIYESHYYPMYGSERAMGLGGAGDVEMAVAPSVQPGETEITVNINLVYKIK
jgi:uncharacterized protein YggE